MVEDTRKLIVIGLVVALFISMAAVIALPFVGKEAPTEIWTIITGLVTGLFGVINPSTEPKNG